MPHPLELYDVTLRDGAQGPGIKFSSEDQIRIVRSLDAFGIHYIEAGQPGANPKAAELFERVRDMELSCAKVVAFGSTCHAKSTVEEDVNLQALLSTQTPVITIFAKASPLHVTHVLKVSLDRNLSLIEESVRYLRAQGRQVFVDSEHFYDAYKEDAAYALATLKAAHHAGAERLILCDTNGGCLSHEIVSITRAVREYLPEAILGIHCHNDSGCAVANTLISVTEGVTQIQGTINGYGERTGNTNLCSIIPNLQLKMGYSLVSDEQLSQLTRLSHLVAELANMTPRDADPFVGRDAFTHKAGMHADAVKKLKSTYEHIDPARVGNRTHITVSEMSGKASLMHKAAELGVDIEKDTPELRAILSRIKELENEGYEFEGAEASLELLMRKAKGEFQKFFTLKGFHVTVRQASADGPAVCEATVKIEFSEGELVHTVAEGHGPVDALNNALRKAIEPYYPEVATIHLDDYKVRIIDAKAATRAKTRVLIESSDIEDAWSTVGVSENIISASYEALVESIAYKLIRSNKR